MDQHEARRDDERTVRVPERVDLIEPRYDVPQEERYGAYPGMVPPQRPPRRSQKKLVFWLFIATCLSTFVAQAWPLVAAGLRLGRSEIVLAGLQDGLVFSVCLISILLAHEMGHYLQSRRHRVPASLPYFIPMPISPFGTMGAVIIQQGLPDRKQWFDIAISGPLAGLVLALPLMYYGVVHSEVEKISSFTGGAIYGNPPLLEWIIAWVHKPLGPGEDIDLTPVLFASWVGVFITALNLIPIGQLDGGHILYCLIGRRSHRVAVVLLWGAVGYMLYTGNYSYSLIVILLLLMGPRHPPTANDRVPLGWPRIVLGWLTLGFIFIGFTPTPIVFLEPEENIRQRPPVRRPSDLVVMAAEPEMHAGAERSFGREVRLKPARGAPSDADDHQLKLVAGLTAGGARSEFRVVGLAAARASPEMVRR